MKMVGRTECHQKTGRLGQIPMFGPIQMEQDRQVGLTILGSGTKQTGKPTDPSISPTKVPTRAIHLLGVEESHHQAGDDDAPPLPMPANLAAAVRTVLRILLRMGTTVAIPVADAQVAPRPVGVLAAGVTPPAGGGDGACRLDMNRVT